MPSGSAAAGGKFGSVRIKLRAPAGLRHTRAPVHLPMLACRAGALAKAGAQILFPAGQRRLQRRRGYSSWRDWRCDICGLLPPNLRQYQKLGANDLQLIGKSGVLKSMDSSGDSKRVRSWLLTAILLVVVVGLLVVIAIPNFVHSGPSRLSGIVNNLRQIDGAKEQWAFEHGITNSALATNLLTEIDIAPLLSSGRDRIGRNGFGFDRKGYPHPGAGEVYFVNRLGLSPEAHLTRDFKERHGFSLPKGTIIRLSGMREQIILPGQLTNQAGKLIPLPH